VFKGQYDAADLLGIEVRRDPAAAAGLTSHSHLFMIAQPVGAPPDLLERVIGGSGPSGWRSFLYGQVLSGPAGRRLTPGWSSDLPEAGDPTRRARGWALRSEGMRVGRNVEAPPLDPIVSGIDVEKRLLDLEINEDGGLRLFCGRASDTLRGVEYVIDGLIIGLAKRTVLVAETVASTTGWVGSWDFGVAVTGLHRFTSEDQYQETVRATYERLVKDSDGIVVDLTARLNRALGGSAPIPQ